VRLLLFLPFLLFLFGLRLMLLTVIAGLVAVPACVMVLVAAPSTLSPAAFCVYLVAAIWHEQRAEDRQCAYETNKAAPRSRRSQRARQ
jgi:hypothetical protein